MCGGVAKNGQPLVRSNGHSDDDVAIIEDGGQIHQHTIDLGDHDFFSIQVELNGLGVGREILLRSIYYYRSHSATPSTQCDSINTQPKLLNQKLQQTLHLSVGDTGIEPVTSPV